MGVNLSVISLLMVSAAIGSAAPVCVTSSLADFEALGTIGCSINDVVFSNFEYDPVIGSLVPSASDILVLPVAASNLTLLGNGSGPLLYFAAGTALNTGPRWQSPTEPQSLNVYQIDYAVRAQGSSAIRQGSLFQGVAFEQISGDASIFLRESFCIGGLFGSGCPFGIPQLVTYTAPFSQQSQDTQIFQPVTTLIGVRTILTLDSGSAGFAETRLFSEFFAVVNEEQVPEPVTFPIAGLGLIGVTIGKRWMRKN